MIRIICLMPRMPVNLAAFNFITTVYLIFGSIHEEKRFVETYRQAYTGNRTSEINFPTFLNAFYWNKRKDWRVRHLGSQLFVS
jgi:hypothetical protein